MMVKVQNKTYNILSIIIQFIIIYYALEFNKIFN